jgi:flavoprotein
MGTGGRGCCGGGGVAGRIFDGIAGLSKVGLQLAGVPVDRASDAVTLARRDACRECPAATRNAARLDRRAKGLTSLSRCRECDCVIAAKTRLASERCPLGKWPT